MSHWLQLRRTKKQQQNNDSSSKIQYQTIANTHAINSSINWGSFYNQGLQRKSPTLQTINQPNAHVVQVSSMAKRRKFQMKKLESVASQQSTRYSVSRIDR